jgi:hypothetical protein
MKRAVLVALLAACADPIAPSKPSEPPATCSAGTLTLVGTSSLTGRGMRGQIAVVGTHAYIGSRTDGSRGSNNGVLIVDVGDTTRPRVVGLIGRPTQALGGVAATELRAHPAWEVLFVLGTDCPVRRSCASIQEESYRINAYDIADREHPVLLSDYAFEDELAIPHEFYLWLDPNDRDRALLWVATPYGPPGVQVIEARRSAGRVSLERIAVHHPPLGGSLAYVHSLAVSPDGRRAHVAGYYGGYVLLDTSSVAEGVANPGMREIARWQPSQRGPLHSVVEDPTRSILVLPYELFDSELCAGFIDFLDLGREEEPRALSRFQLGASSGCRPQLMEREIIDTPHNVTVARDRVFATWYGQGLVVISTTDPTRPTLLAQFRPALLESVEIEDPRYGGSKVLMTSHPVIADGLIYVVDTRNGLFILKYDECRVDVLAGMDAQGNVGPR